MHNFSDLFDKVLYMFQTGPLSIIRGCHCSHWAPDDEWENARNMLSCKQTEKLLHQVDDLFELYDDARTYKP
jgi:hypothetical protein